MPRLPKLPIPDLQALRRRFKPPKPLRPPSLAEVVKRAEEAFIRFNQGPCADGKAHVFKTQPFPPYSREYCAKCGVDKDDLATYKEGLRTYHGVGERLWSGGPVPALATAAAAGEAAPAPRRGLGAPVVVSAGLALFIIGLGLSRPPLEHSGASFFLMFAGMAVAIVSGMIWAADLGSKSNPAARQFYGFSDAQPKGEERTRYALDRAAVTALLKGLVAPTFGALSVALMALGLVFIWPPQTHGNLGLFLLFSGVASGILLGLVWAAGGRTKSGHAP
ncbi:MAG: hypothetical protein EXR60_06900 [Dehalococcoidia bacterium]|nr:hypothetical protein [Dehalococcoidia bacterium]